MPKRSREESKEDRWRRKMKKYENRLRNKRYIVYSSDEEDLIEETQEPEIEEQYEDIVGIPATPIEDEVVTEDVHPGTPAPATAAAGALGPAAETTAVTADEATLPDIDPELLQALGSFEEEATVWGEPILEHIAKRLTPLLISGLKKDDRESLLKKYPFPKNVSMAKAPTLNAEISAMLTDNSRSRDKRLHTKQNQLGTVLSCITKAMSLLMCKEPKIVDILSCLSDASKLLADSHFLETDTRRALIITLIDKELIDPIKDRKRDDYLFGENLGQMVKNSRGIKKTSQLIQGTPKTNLNSRGPPSRGRQQKNYLNRGGGQQRPYPRRAAPYPQPAAPARRQPAAQHASRRQPPATAAGTSRGAAPTATDRARTQ